MFGCGGGTGTDSKIVFMETRHAMRQDRVILHGNLLTGCDTCIHTLCYGEQERRGKEGSWMDDG